MDKLQAMLNALLKLPEKLFTGPLISVKQKSKHTSQEDKEWSLDKSVIWIAFIIYAIVHFIF